MSEHKAHEHDKKHEHPKKHAKGGVESREEAGRTVYSKGGTDLLTHKEGDQHYCCRIDVPEQGLLAGHVYHLSPPDYEESLGHVLTNLSSAAKPAKE